MLILYINQWLSRQAVFKLLSSQQSVIKTDICHYTLLPSQVLASVTPIHLWRSLTVAALHSSRLSQDAHEQAAAAKHIVQRFLHTVPSASVCSTCRQERLRYASPQEQHFCKLCYMAWATQYPCCSIVKLCNTNGVDSASQSCVI